MSTNAQPQASTANSITPPSGKLETFELTKPHTPRLPIDHSALEELHMGPIPCVRVRESPNQPLDPSHQLGTTKQFRGRMTVLNIPKGFYRIDSPKWDEQMASSYGEKKSDGSIQEVPLVDLSQNSHFFFWLYDLEPGQAPKGDKYSTTALDYCEYIHSEGDVMQKSDGRDNACDQVFRVGSSQSNFVCEYRYYPNTDFKLPLRDLLRDKYFKRTPKMGSASPTPQQIQERSQKSVKMIATMIPGRGIVWLPLVEGKKNGRDYDDLLAGDTAIVYRLQFLDGPNILIGKLKDTPW